MSTSDTIGRTAGRPAGPLWIARFILLLFSFILAILIPELYLRINRANVTFVRTFDPNLHFTFDIHTGFLFRPHERFNYRAPDGTENEVVTNSLGFRTPYEPDGSAHDVVVLADSFGSGVQVAAAQTFPTVMESTLTQNLGREIRVVNGGINGFEPAQYLLEYVYFLHKYKPNVVVVGLFLGNDLRDDGLSHGEIHSVWPHHTDQGVHKIVNWLIDNSYFCNYVVATITRLNDFPRFRGFPVVDRQRLLAIRELMENDRGQRVSLPDVYEIASQYDDEGNFLGAYGADGWPENPATRYKIEVATLRLRQLRDECKKRGTDKILVCIIPSRLMGDFPDVSTEVEQLRGLGLISNRFAVTGKYFTDRMDAILQRDGFSTVNIGTVIHDKHLPLGRELYWPVDGHFNVTGYRMMGEAIAQRLIQLGWISKN